MKRDWITRKAMFVPLAPTGRIVIAGPEKRSTEAREANRVRPSRRVRDGQGAKTSLAVCGTLRLRVHATDRPHDGAATPVRDFKSTVEALTRRIDLPVALERAAPGT